MENQIPNQMNNKQKQVTYSLGQHLRNVRREAGKDFNAFRKLYFPHYNSMPDAPFHEEMARMLNDISHRRGVKIAVAAPRRSAKSTLVTLEYILWLICYKLEDFILIISATSSQAAGFLTDIKKELETNPKIMIDFPEVCETGRKPGPPRWTQNEIMTRNKIRILALGTGQQVRGRRNQEHRPSLIILDDIEDGENEVSSEVQDKWFDWVTKSVLKAGSATSNVICIGTIHHYNSILAQLTSLNTNPGWIKKVYRAVISWSQHPELWEKWIRMFNNHEDYEGESGPVAAKLFFEVNKEAMLEGTEVLWPLNMGYYDLMVMREQDGHYSFDSEMQNEPVNPRECYFNLEEIHYWDDKFQTEQDLISALGDRLEFYGACDPSMGKSKKRGDYSAILTIALDSKTGTMYVLDADIFVRFPDKTIEDILWYAERRNYQRFGFEINQFQEIMKDNLEKRRSERRVSLPIEDIKNTTDKIARIESLQPMIKSGAIQFSRKHITLLGQMKFFPKGAHDDGLDALEMTVRLAQEGSGPLIWDISHVPVKGVDY